MKPINLILLILCILVALVGLSIILFKYFNERINLLLKRLDQSESEYNNKIKNKNNIIIRMINIVENRYKTH